ncbi:YciE/YciF ferroxidase family protein [Natronorubrum sp. DTA28]|uniref:YciE/YciF ferroxidase family protein n=1 Tax=Natronorubrum sp. DTA28 TaxID=3447019 RepID=UPI003F855EBD
MNIETLEDLFGYQLQRAYYVERTQVELLAEMVSNTSDDDLTDRLATHREQTEDHVVRLEGLFEALGRQPHASRTRTADGVAESWRQHEESPESVPTVLEIALVSERLEIRAYESLLTLAGRLAYDEDVVEPLEATLAEERATLGALEALETERSALEPIATDET